MKSAHQMGQTGALGLLGIAPARFEDPYFSQILQGAQNEASEAGREVVLLQPHTPIAWHTVDAVLLAGDHLNFLPTKPSQLPCVSLLFHDENLASVVVDDYEGVRQATERLIDLGHGRIAYLSLTDHRIMRLRIAGYQRALNDAGIVASPEWLRGMPTKIFQQQMDEQRNNPRDHMRQWGYRFMQNWLQTDWKKVGCTALLTQNDHVAIGALAAFQEAGVSVPAEVSLIGFDDSSFCESTMPSLSSITIPLFEVGAAGVRSLLRELDRMHSQTPAPKNSAEVVVLPARFHARDSITVAP